MWPAVSEVVAGVADLGHECFVNSGSLLGLVREGGVIAHDDDVDLGVVLRATDAAGAAAEWLALRGRLGAAGLLNLEFEERRKGHCKARLPVDITVDLFPAWASRGRMYVWPHTYGAVAVEDVLPLVRQEVAGTMRGFHVDPNGCWRSTTAPTGRPPTPTFRFDWRAARARFHDFVDAMAMSPGESGA